MFEIPKIYLNHFDIMNLLLFCLHFFLSKVFYIKFVCVIYWTSDLNNLRGGELSLTNFPLTNFNPLLNDI